MLEMEKDCKDMLIMEQLQACCLSQGLKTRLGDGKRHKVNYQYENADVCRDCHLYINGIGIKYLKKLKKHMKKSGVVPRVHGNTNRKPKDAITFEDERRAVTFLIGYLFIFLSLILHIVPFIMCLYYFSSFFIMKPDVSLVNMKLFMKLLHVIAQANFYFQIAVQAYEFIYLFIFVL